MRTDSTRISEEARAAAKVHIENTYGKEYYENRYYKTGKDAQDAHEAIRPTYIDLTPESIKDSLTNDQFKLYRLIYNRFIASQMAAAIFDTVSVKVNANSYNFRANGQNLKLFQPINQPLYPNKYLPILYSPCINFNSKTEL